MAAKAKLELIASAGNPPRALGKHGQQLWNTVMREYVIEDPSGVELLCQACQMLDRAEACREQVEADGLIIRTKSGIRDHPAMKHEAIARAFITRTLARLGLDAEPVKAVGRPPQF